jgi:DNA polymerase-4
VGDVAAVPEATLVAIAGRAMGRQLHALAHNRDPRPVKRRSRRRSIGSQRALGTRERSQDELHSILIAVVDRVCRRLRSASRVCRTVVLRLRFRDFERATRSRTLSEPTSATVPILHVAAGLLEASMPLIERRGITLVGIALTNLTDGTAIQLELPLDRRRELDSAVDRVRERFGSAAITRGALVGQDPGISVPLLPD